MVLTNSLQDLLGMQSPDFTLPGIDGNTYTLESFAGSNVLVIIFMCNHCPYVKAVLGRLNRLAASFDASDVAFVGISANDAENYPEDSFEEMQQLPIEFPYLYDESQAVARAYQAVCTPDIFVFDDARKLAYHGRIDDNWKDESAVTKQELRAGIDGILSGNPVAPDAQIPSMGCNIKWKN